MKKIFNKEFKIGIAVIVAIVILIFGIDYLKGINLFNPANFYYAEYENVAGLEISSPVTINGYKVGQVRAIDFNYEKPGKIRVQLALNKDLRVPRDSYAQIESTLLSGAFINLKMGSSKDMVEIGQNVNTAAAPDLMASVQQNLMPTVEAILPRIDTLLMSLNTLAADPALLASIQRLDGITGNVYELTASLKGTVNRDVPRMVRNVNSITCRIDTVSDNLVSLSTQLKQLPLATTMDNVNQITDNLSRFSTQLNDRNSTLGMLMNDPELYRRLNQVSADIDSLIVDIKRNPKRYISIKLL